MQNDSQTGEAADFTGKRILVTGGTKGIGEAIVARLIRGGGNVITTARSVPQAWPIGLSKQTSVRVEGSIRSSRRQWSGSAASTS